MAMILEMEMAAGLMSEQDKVWRIGDIVGYEPREAARRAVECWYVVYVRGSEKAAVRALERRGWTVFMPMAERWVRQKKLRLGLRANRRLSKLRKGRAEREKQLMRRIEVPLYPRYVFVAAQTSRQGWWQVQDVPEISAVIRSDRDTVVRLSPAFIDGLRGRQERGEFVEAERVNALKPQENSRVAIVDGPFASYTGLVVAGGCDSTVICEVTVFGGAMPIEMPLDHVRALD